MKDVCSEAQGGPKQGKGEGRSVPASEKSFLLGSAGFDFTSSF